MDFSVTRWTHQKGYIVLAILTSENSATKTHAEEDSKLKSTSPCEEKMYNEQALGTRPWSTEYTSSHGLRNKMHFPMSWLCTCL